MGRFSQLIIGLALCVATIVGMGISAVSRAEAADITTGLVAYYKLSCVGLNCFKQGVGQIVFLIEGM